MTLIIHTPGGGGYGDLKRRDPEMFLRDVLKGLVSAESAERDYAVSIRDGEVDENRTQLLRIESEVVPYRMGIKTFQKKVIISKKTQFGSPE